eukprot:gene7399-15106_t
MISLLVFIVLNYVVILDCQLVEQFHIHGPSDLHKVAVDTYLEERKKNPQEDLGENSNIMKRARDHAIKRFSTKAENELLIRRTTPGDSNDNTALLQLPAPDVQGGYLAAAVSASSTGSELITTETISAMAVQIKEDIGLGAISKAGALPFGEDAGWIKFAEDKLKSDAQLDYQALLWELGSEVIETEQIRNGGLNMTNENILLENLNDWFIQKGGALKYLHPAVTQTDGYHVTASEDIESGEIIISTPIALTMCRISARNVVLPNKSKYLGEELKKTFEKNEVWGLTIFLLHEWYKETAGSGSKWGPLLRCLRLKSLSTPVIQSLRGTVAVQLLKRWNKDSDALRHYSTGIDGPCSPTTGVCKVKPLEKFADSRFDLHQIRWAYFVVQQHAVRIYHSATGKDFLALVPFADMLKKNIGSGGKVTLDLDGSVRVRVGSAYGTSQHIEIDPGNITDSELFMKYMTISDNNPHNFIKIPMPGALPEGSAMHGCLKMYDKKACRSDSQGSALQWKMKALSDWRKQMNLPPRLGELRLWATRLHLYGDDEEEQKRLSASNQLIAGLPISTDEVSAEDQLMMLGMARTTGEAAALVASGGRSSSSGGGGGGGTGLTVGDDGEFERPPPQLYTAPDPEEDPEAKRSMENLATLAVQVQTVISTGNLLWNATRAVLNQTRDFFQYGVLPGGGLDVLDDFLLKKLGLLSHCGVGGDMKLTSLAYTEKNSSSSSSTNSNENSTNVEFEELMSHANSPISKELMCAMRVHLLTENETHIFCPAEAKVWENNCQEVEFANYTAISLQNEIHVIAAFRSTVSQMLAAYPHTIELDRCGGVAFGDGHCDVELGTETDTMPESQLGPVMQAAIRLRLREKVLLSDVLSYLNDHEESTKNGTVKFQLDIKKAEREVADRRLIEHKKFIEEVERLANIRLPLASISVDMEGSSFNLTLVEGADLKQTVLDFCQKHNIGREYLEKLQKALKDRVVNPPVCTLMLGVVSPLGFRAILGLEEGKNSTVETGVFCSRNNITESECDKLQNRVAGRLNPLSYSRRVLVSLTADAPDGRKLQLVVREGEQHDLYQFVSDFFQYYKMPTASIDLMYNEVYK